MGGIGFKGVQRSCSKSFVVIHAAPMWRHCERASTDIGQEENGMGMETIRTLRLDQLNSV